jgi:hypothetical protein
VNIYLDPEDNMAFEPKDLTPLEKGHEYRCKILDNSRVIVHNPYRVFDAETQHAVQTYATLQAEPPYSVSGALSAEGRKRVGSIWHTFSLSHEEFIYFRKYAERSGWRILKGMVDVEAALTTMNALYNEMHAAVQTFRGYRALIGPQAVLSTPVLEVLDALDELRVQSTVLRTSRYKEFVDLVATCNEGLSSVEFQKLTGVISKLTTLREQMASMDFAELSKRISDKYAHSSNSAAVVASPEELAKELELLKSLYPVLSILSYDVPNRELVIRIDGTVIKYAG